MLNASFYRVKQFEESNIPNKQIYNTHTIGIVCRTNNGGEDDDGGGVSNATKTCEDSRQLTQLLENCVSQIKFRAGKRIENSVYDRHKQNQFECEQNEIANELYSVKSHEWFG